MVLAVLLASFGKRQVQTNVGDPPSANQSGGGVSPPNQGRDGPATLPNPQLSYGSTESRPATCDWRMAKSGGIHLQRQVQ
jgi:hypothetical protein